MIDKAGRGGKDGEDRGETRMYIGCPAQGAIPFILCVTWLERHQVHFDVTSNDDSSE